MPDPILQRKTVIFPLVILLIASFGFFFFGNTQQLPSIDPSVNGAKTTITPASNKLTKPSITPKTRYKISPTTIPTLNEVDNVTGANPTTNPTSGGGTGTGTAPNGLRVSGNKLVNTQGQTVRLFGANRSGTEYMCLGGNFSDGPADLASLQAMQRWHINTVRIPMNEHCWLGVNGAVLGGDAYQKAIVQYVNTITANNMVAILDLHWNAPGTIKAEGQNPMPDADHTPKFWREVALTFSGNNQVIFDIFNEPDPIPYRGDYPGGFSQWQRDDFNCVLNGCEVKTKTGIAYQGVGMQTLVDTIRGTGATNIIMVPGIQSAQTISQYTGNKNTSPSGFMPVDPLNNLAVAMHSYNNAACSDVSCWEATVAPVAKIYPIITGEFGDTDCSDTYTKQLLPWLDKNNISYVGWTWDVWPNSCERLINSYDGTPSAPYGQAYYKHLQSIH